MQQTAHRRSSAWASIAPISDWFLHARNGPTHSGKGLLAASLAHYPAALPDLLGIGTLISSSFQPRGHGRVLGDERILPSRQFRQGFVPATNFRETRDGESHSRSTRHEGAY